MSKVSNRDATMVPREERAKAIDAAMSSIERMFGKGSIMRYGDTDLPAIECISTGSLSVDICLGIGGMPRGRVCEIYGAEASGKTTLALQTIANAQAAGGMAAFVDAEHALDVNYARNLGVKVDELLISQPDTGEQGLEITETLVRSGAIDIIVIDSVAALVPRAELEGDMGDVQPGAQARLMSQALRKLTGAINKSNCTVIFINQIREKIGVMFGSPKVTSGGKALKFYASVRVEITRIGSIKKGDEIIGNRTKINVTKNKLAPPFRQAEFEIYYGEGVSQEAELLDLGVIAGAVRKSGSWYARGDDRLGQGKENSRQFLKENPDVAAQIRHEVLVFNKVIVEPAVKDNKDNKDDKATPVAEA